MSKQIKKAKEVTESEYELLISASKQTAKKVNPDEYDTFMMTAKVPATFGKLNEDGELTYEWPENQSVYYPRAYMQNVPFIGRRDVGKKTTIYTEGMPTQDNVGPMTHALSVQWRVGDDEERNDLLLVLAEHADKAVDLEVYRQPWSDGSGNENIVVKCDYDDPTFGITPNQGAIYYVDFSIVGMHNVFPKFRKRVPRTNK